MNEAQLLNEFGIEIASENIAKKMRILMEHKNDEDFKQKLQQLIADRDEIAKGNMNVIKKYVKDVGNG